jgi:alpha-beta hydrolase superfamily lysophospholipase
VGELVNHKSSLSGFHNQVVNQAQILAQLGSLIKSGKYTGAVGVPKKLVLVGHSFGSQLSDAVMVESPKLADAAILTGYNEASDGAVIIESVAPRVAALQNKKWAHLDPGYLT